MPTATSASNSTQEHQDGFGQLGAPKHKFSSLKEFRDAVAEITDAQDFNPFDCNDNLNVLVADGLRSANADIRVAALTVLQRNKILDPSLFQAIVDEFNIAGETDQRCRDLHQRLVESIRRD